MNKLILLSFLLLNCIHYQTDFSSNDFIYKTEKYNWINSFCNKNNMRFENAGNSVKPYSDELYKYFFQYPSLAGKHDTVKLSFVYTSKFKTRCIDIDNIDDALLGYKKDILDSINLNILLEWDPFEPKSQYSININALLVRNAQKHKFEIFDINYCTLFGMYADTEMIHSATSRISEILKSINDEYDKNGLHVKGNILLNSVIDENGEIIYLKVLSSEIENNKIITEICRKLVSTKTNISLNRVGIINCYVSFSFN